LADGITVGDGYHTRRGAQAVNAVRVGGGKPCRSPARPVADPLFSPWAAIIMQVYTVNIIQPANTFTRRRSGNETSNTDLRGRDVIALGALLQVEGLPSRFQRAILLRGGQLAAAVAVARRRCQPPAGHSGRK